MSSIPCPLKLQSPRQPGRPVLLGYSGGMDSSVLLHLLAADEGIRAGGLRAIHVHHGLHAEADAWVAHCQRECDALGVPLQVVHVAVERDAGLGLEGAARKARHAAFVASMVGGEILALAHHLDDQAETFLLRALRGSGVDGLAGMCAWRAYPPGWLWRPLLDQPRTTLTRYAAEHRLCWVEDPSNASIAADRNLLRNQILPALRERWPAATSALAGSAALCAQASALLADEDAACLAQCSVASASTGAVPDPALLSVAALRSLPEPRRARVLRLWVATLGLPPLPARAITRIESELLPAHVDAQPSCDWSGVRVERWRDLLHVARIHSRLPLDWAQSWMGESQLALPDGGRLALIGADKFDAPLQVRARRGGERITLPDRRHSHALKHLLQDAAIPPWRRVHLPLLFDGDGELMAAGDRIVSARLQAWLEPRGARLQWACVA